MDLVLGLSITVFISGGLLAVAWIIERSLRLKSPGFLIIGLAIFAITNFLAFSGGFDLSYCEGEQCRSTISHLMAALLFAAPSLTALMLLNKTERPVSESI